MTPAQVALWISVEALALVILCFVASQAIGWWKSLDNSYQTFVRQPEPKRTMR